MTSKELLREVIRRAPRFKPMTKTDQMAFGGAPEDALISWGEADGEPTLILGDDLIEVVEDETNNPNADSHAWELKQIF